ncbi:MAG: MerR family transcriptional regulator [Rhodothermales bacterium]|jgi:DNA-binding transcriptional MerR regulator
MPSLPISELAERAGVSARTIRYYVSEGLLPAPRSRGRYAEYGLGHVERLKLIAQFKDAYLPLKEIRNRVSDLTDRQVREILESNEADRPALGGSEKVQDRTSSEGSVGSPWIRYRLEDGIELNVTGELPPWRARILRRLLSEINALLRDW